MNEKLKRNFENQINKISMTEKYLPEDMVALSLDLYNIIKDQDEEISQLKETLELRTGRLP